MLQQFLQGLQFITDSRLGFRTNYPADANGLLLIGGIILILITNNMLLPESKFAIFRRLMTEKIYEFFEEIMGKEEKPSIKIYVVVLFFVILLSNTMGLILDIIKMPTRQGDGEFRLDTLFNIPTGNINFNIVLSTISVIIMLITQHKSLGNIFKTLHEYIPITGKNILTIEKEGMKPVIYYIAYPIIKLFDIAISLFIGFLDIVGLAAKVISLAARLAGNMFSGPLLLAMLVGSLVGATSKLMGINFPVLFVLLVYIQGLLVALIQAFVFPLLVGIFIKMAHGDE